MSGILFVVPTPVGNLEDITLRAIRTLKECDYILAEDTRTSGSLLKHLGVDKPLHSYHQHNEHGILENLTADLIQGKNIALISDAGTPGISDPGFLLVRECVRHKIKVQTLPGPTAFVPALVNSGLPCDTFVFYGFLPQKKGRQSKWKEIEYEHRTMVFYESPFRIEKFLQEARERLGENRLISVSREISKLYEETIRGTVAELISHFKTKAPKGEFVLIVEGLNLKSKSENEA